MEIKQDLKNEFVEKDGTEQITPNTSASGKDELLSTKENNKSESSQESELKSRLKHCEEEMLKCLLEAQNMRNRYEAQIAEVKKYALTNIAKEIISVMDNLDMALKSEKEDLVSLKQTIAGVKLTKTQLESIFTKFKIRKIEPKIGDPFDYELHHAVAQVPNTSQKESSIIEVMQIGYAIEDRLLRAALVSVASAD